MRFSQVQLSTVKLQAQQHFYTEQLGFPLVMQSESAFTVRVGSTHLTFNQTSAPQEPTYHFAFNVPENQIDSALSWVEPRAEVIRTNGKAVYLASDAWNADLLYFYDAAGNIVEFIARHNLNNATQQPFSTDSILNVSEVGIVVPDVPEYLVWLEEHLGQTMWQGNGQDFAAVGDEQGLLIVAQQGRNWFPLDNMPATVHPTTVSISGLLVEKAHPHVPYVYQPSV